MADSREVDQTGLVWQDGKYGQKKVGEIHETKAGRFNVVMVGRKITPKSVKTFDEARTVALDYQPEADDAAILDQILGSAR